MNRYFSVDCEFSGLNHRKNCLLSIGIIEVDLVDGKYIPNYNRELYLELKPEGEVNEESMKINKLNLDNLSEYGVSKQNATKEIIKYLDLKENDSAVFIGYCLVLDKIFTDQIFQDINLESPFHYETIEISSLALGKLDLEWGFSEQQLLDILKLKPLTDEEKHNALNDARLQAREFCELMNLKHTLSVG